MSSLDLVIFILRHVDSPETAILWKSSYESIRHFYPKTMIVIIDNNSNQTYIESLPFDVHCKIITSELPEGRVFVPYYYYYTEFSEYNKAIILHDSTILQKKLDIDEISTIKYLWHFEIHQYDNKPTGHIMLSILSNTSELHAFYDSNKWHGCLGCMSVITSSFLQKLNNKYNLLSLKNIIVSSISACEFERILSVLSTTEDPNLYSNASLFGDISMLEWGLTYEKYILNKEKYSEYPVIKLFGARYKT